MRSFLLRRAAQSLLLLLAVSVLTFALSALSPGDPLEGLRLRSDIAPQTLETLRLRYGLDRPLPARYATWLGRVVTGDLGYSVLYAQPVGPLLMPRIRNTLLLGSCAVGLAWLIALPLGVWAGSSRRRWVGAGTEAATSTLLAIPDLVLALGLLVLSLRYTTLPTGGMLSDRLVPDGLAGAAVDLARHLILPVVALALSLLPTLIRHVRVSVAAALSSPGVAGARARGLSRRRLLYHHVLPLAANPLVSLFGFSIGTLLSASLVVEIVMSWPGVGPLTLEAILARDLDLVVALLLASTVLLAVGNTVADLLLRWLDPRLRSS